MKDTGVKCHVAADKPELTEQQKAARLQWAQQHQGMTAEDWCSVVFSDESSFRSDQHCKKRVWRERGTR